MTYVRNCKEEHNRCAWESFPMTACDILKNCNSCITERVVLFAFIHILWTPSLIWRLFQNQRYRVFYLQTVIRSDFGRRIIRNRKAEPNRIASSHIVELFLAQFHSNLLQNGLFRNDIFHEVFMIYVCLRNRYQEKYQSKWSFLEKFHGRELKKRDGTRWSKRGSVTTSSSPSFANSTMDLGKEKYKGP